ncbi:MAG TPA: DUF47 family protein [Candidatus Paceibacterota bacterium]
MSLWDSLTFNGLLAFFGNKENAIIASGLRELMGAAQTCSSKLGLEGKLRESDMIEDEHRGDAALKKIGEAIERGFSIRFGKSDPTKLAHELDDVIDGMRDVARHIETNKMFLDPFPVSSGRLVHIVIESVAYLGKVIDEIVSDSANRDRLNVFSIEISDLEHEADVIRAQAEKELALSPLSSIPDFRAFLAVKGLNDILEKITDHTKHCAVVAVSMARQEA